MSGGHTMGRGRESQGNYGSGEAILLHIYINKSKTGFKLQAFSAFCCIFAQKGKQDNDKD